MPADGTIVIEARDPACRDRQLDEAARILSEQATECGILITRHSFRTFSVTLSAGVEYGHIQELDLL